MRASEGGENVVASVLGINLLADTLFIGGRLTRVHASDRCKGGR